MKREIKFRAWTGSKMLHNVGFHPFMTFRLDAYDILNKEEEGYTEGENLITNPKITDLMQFTGHHDEQQAPIYEGDLVMIHSGTTDGAAKPWEVYFDQNSAAWALRRAYYNPIFLHRQQIKAVVGNIYENPQPIPAIGTP